MSAGTRTAAELVSRVEGLRDRQFLGASVTVPHKIAVRDLLDEVSPAARRAGAVNTIVNRGGALFGDNTDIYGFGVTVSDGLGGRTPQVAVVLGAGGAARAVVLALEAAGAGEIIVANRDVDRAAQLARELDPAPVRSMRLDEEFLARELPRADVLVNATSLGWHPGETPIALSRLALLPAGALVADLTYRDTDLLLAAQRRGTEDSRRIADARSSGGQGIRAVDGRSRAGGNDAGGRPRGPSANLIGGQEGAGGVNVAARTDRISVTFVDPSG